jgi:hypothetical protein
MRQSDGSGKKGIALLPNVATDPVFTPPTSRYTPPYGAIGSGRPQPPHPPPLPLQMHSGSSPALSAMASITPPGSPGRAVMPPIDNRPQGASGLAPMSVPSPNPSHGTALAPMRQSQSQSQPGGASASGLSPMPRGRSGSDAPRAPADHIAIDIAPEQPAVHAPGQQPASPATLRQKVGKFAPLVDGLAAGASLAASRLTSGSLASTVTGAVSGVLWSGTAGMSEAGNTQPSSRLASTANFLNFGAGALSTAAVFNSDSTQTNLGYASSAAWGASAFTSMAHAVVDGTRGYVSRGLQIGSGFANLAAAGLSAASVHASAKEDTTSAAWYGTGSSLAWMAGAALAYGSARTASSSNPSPRAAPAMPAVASESTSLRGAGGGRSFGTTIQSV